MNLVDRIDNCKLIVKILAETNVSVIKGSQMCFSIVSIALFMGKLNDGVTSLK